MSGLSEEVVFIGKKDFGTFDLSQIESALTDRTDLSYLKERLNGCNPSISTGDNLIDGP